ncbi:MAG: hypothetical protein RLZZ524_440 [Pseudomonadota bacterium]
MPANAFSKPCEYCGCDLPHGVDKGTRRIRSFHFDRCDMRPRQFTPAPEPSTMQDLLLRAADAIEALDGTSVENEKLVDDYRAWRARQGV